MGGAGKGNRDHGSSAVLAWRKKRGLPPTPRASWHSWRRRRQARGGRVGARLARTSARTVTVIVSLHVAGGAAAGAASGSRVAAVLLGPILHLAGDRLPHQDIGSRRFEIGPGLAGLVLLAARRGPLDPATLGAAASSAPDLEHVLPFLRPGGSKLFHGRRSWHRSRALPGTPAAPAGGAILGALVAPRSKGV